MKYNLSFLNVAKSWLQGLGKGQQTDCLSGYQTATVPDGSPTVERKVGVPFIHVLTTLLPLTLGIGQMWANSVGFESEGNGIKYYYSGANTNQSWEVGRDGTTKDLSTITSLYLKEYWIKMYQENTSDIYGKDHQHMYYKVHRQAVSAGSTGFTNIAANWWNWNGDDGTSWRKPTGGNNNQNVNLLDGLGSGKYQMSFYFEQNGSSTWRCPSGSTNNTLKWTIAVPAVSGGTVTSNGSGSGTSGSPFIVADGNTITFTASGSQASTDANSVLYVKWGNDNYSTTITKTITPTTTQQSMTVKLKYCNSADNLSGAETSLTIHYQSTVTPSIAVSSFTQDASTVTAVNSGETVTINASRQNAGTANITYQYSTDNSNWTTIGSATSSTTQLWTVPAVSTTTNYYVKVIMTYNAVTYSDTKTLTVYGKKTIKVKNTNNWATMNLYCYGAGEREAWPGSTTGVSSAGGQWKTIVLTSQYPYFILNDGSGNQIKGDNTYSYTSSVTDGNCYAIGSGTGTSLALSSTTCPSTPTLTTASANSITATSVTFNASGVANGNDKITAYGFKWGTTNDCSDGTVSASNLGTGTTFSANKTELTNGTTYYYKAYATNGQGTTYGSVQSFRTKYVTAVTLDKQGGTSGTDNVSATEGSAMPSGKTAPSKIGYTFGGYYASENGGGTQYYSATMTSAHAWDVAAATATIYAKWTANTYTVVYNANGGTGTTASSSHTYDAAKALTTNGYTKTGYSFGGWATSQANADAGTKAYDDAESVTNLASEQGATVTLYAIWTANTYPATFSQSGEGYSSGTVSNQTVSYGAAMPSITPPTAANGYAFMGYWDGENGTGTQYYNADGTSAHVWDKTTNATLHAYFKKAEITAVTLNATVFGIVAEGDEGYVVANPTIAPTPAGETEICWELLYSNGNPAPSGHDALAYTEEGKPNQVRFPINGLAAGGYMVRATLHTGKGACGSGTTLSTRDQTFTIANEFTVTVQYKCGDIQIKASTESPGKPVETTEITAPDVFGYTFSKWKAGDGIEITGANAAGEKADKTIRYTAFFNGTLTAVYTKKKYIYLDISQTFGSGKWNSPYVYFYKSSGYWDNTNGAGATGDACVAKGAMTLVPGSNDIYYYDYSGVSNFGNVVAFTWGNHMGDEHFNGVDAIYRGDFSEATPLFIPAVGQTEDTHQAKYFNRGYWVNYIGEQTGYTLCIYAAADQAPIKTMKFTSDDKRMPMKATVDLEAEHTYYMEVLRDNGHYYKNAEARDNSNSQANWAYTEDAASKGKMVTTAAGNYTFTLSYADFNNDKDFQIRMKIDYPAETNDFQILYNDLATWSLGTAHTAAWRHPSRIIKARANGVDTISFFVTKDKTPQLYARKVSSINASNGKITWAALNIAENTSMDINSTVSESAVYNFKVTQSTAGVIQSIENIGAYKGSYYIRCGALNSKWDNYTTDSDHRMTYSSFSESDANKFGEKFSHYKAKWCIYSTDVRFCIANDYSPCITDTLIQDVGNPYNNILADGKLNTDGNSSATNNIYSANIRFMWNRKTNKISRAYVSSATNEARLFLVLRAEKELRNDDNTEITSVPENSVILADKQNWMYETTIMVNPGTRFKLFACYAEKTPTEAKAQYFRGAYDSDQFTNDNNSVILIGGTPGQFQKARIIYDFKINRLIAAWVPTVGTDVTGEQNINADVLIEREHQEAAECVTFANDALGNEGQLTGVKTVYGAMKFNRWILGNRKNSADDDPTHAKTDEQISQHHKPLDISDQKSVYERSLYFISFPFDVRVSEIFGFGSYGTEWVIEYYDGLNRAKNGFWIDSPSNWKFVTPTMAETYVLKAYQGYILCLNLSRMAYNDQQFWANGISTVELFFPSTMDIETLKQTNITIDGLSEEYKCTINRGTAEGDRRVKDSYWRVIGVPSLNLYNSALTDESGNTIEWKSNNWVEDGFPYIYMWNKGDNTLTPQATSNFTFLPMHAYMVQNGGKINWTSVNAKPTSVVARRANDMPATEYEWRLELAQDSLMIDQTYIRMSDIEQVTDSFDFGQDLAKELNATRSNLYSFIGYEPVAANSMTLHTEETTVVPMGLEVIADGGYTLSMPDGTNGVGVTLLDSETGVRTNLSAGMAYTLNLAKGEYNNRFFVEIAPVKSTPTGLTPTLSQEEGGKTRKVMIDGLLYIVRDGKIYDARGARVE